MSGCIAEIAKHASFVFWHTKNAISQSPFRMLQTVCSSGNDLTHKLLLLRGFPVCLPVSSMLKLRLPQFLFYKTAPVFPWSVWFNRIIVIHSLNSGKSSCTFIDALLKKEGRFLENHLRKPGNKLSQILFRLSSLKSAISVELTRPSSFTPS